MSEFERASAERKDLQTKGEIPDWYTTQAWLMFKRKYAWGDERPKHAFQRIAKALARHVPDLPEAEPAFNRIMWKGHLAPSTPVMTNTGTSRGHSVSCSGGYFADNMDSFYKNHHENAMLSKNGYGTASYLGDIRHRGAPISSGGHAHGVVPVFDTAVDTMTKVSQGNNRRGQWAGYLPIDHPDFWELAGYVHKHNAVANVGWVLTAAFIDRLERCDPDAVKRWNRVMYIRSRFGKGYFWKVDTANRLAPQAVKNSGISIKASQLCTEIALPQDEHHTFSCVLSSLNLAKWDEFDEDTIFWSIVFLDCVVSDMLEKARGMSGFERIVRFTEKARALGLGALGWHSYLQQNMIGMEELQAQFLNTEIFSTIERKAREATLWLGERYGEPEWCKGTGQRNATLMAIAPNTSSALLCGSVSQGIEPIVANAYVQPTSAGEMTRMSPEFVKLAKAKGKYSEELMRQLAVDHEGSVQHLDWLSDHEKLVFKTAFEIDQRVLVRHASQRQQFIDQAQSLNLFFTTDEKYIAEVTRMAILDPRIKSLYYQRSIRKLSASTGSACVACEG